MGSPTLRSISRIGEARKSSIPLEGRNRQDAGLPPTKAKCKPVVAAAFAVILAVAGKSSGLRFESTRRRFLSSGRQLILF